MKIFVKSLEINNEYLRTHEAIPFTLNKKTTGDYIYSWNTYPKFFPEDMKAIPVRIKFLMDHAKMVGLDDLAMPDQQIGDKLIEECHEITYEDFKEMYDSNIAKEQGTLWNVDKLYNALFMRKETHDRVKSEIGRSVALVYPAADCAVVRLYDPKLGVIGLTHSDAIQTTRGIIGKSVDYMVEHFGSNKEDIEVFVGAFAKEGWVYDKFPDFAKEGDGISPVWKDYLLKQGDGSYLIDYGSKIYDQIIASGIPSKNVFFDPDNTLINDAYFSHSRSVNSINDEIPYREGRNMMGITFDKDSVVEKSEEQHVILR